MELQDNCCICRNSMLRKPVVRLYPCTHLLHNSCAIGIPLAVHEDEDGFEIGDVAIKKCPICRHAIEREEEVQRKVYKKHTLNDRERIVACCNRGEDWVALCLQLNVPYKTAYNWVRSGSGRPRRKGGAKKVLNEEQVNTIIEWLENDCCLTLEQIRSKVHTTFNLQVSVSTIGNYLEGRVVSVKNVHKEPTTMNSEGNKTKRRQYVQSLNNYIEEGKQIVWLDETNFNLFCRRSRGRAKVGERAVQKVPASKGPNIHLIGAMSAAGVVAIERRRGSFNSATANAWVQNLLQRWQDIGNQLADLVIVVDNAPCHANLEAVVNPTAAKLLRLAPYSPMLNPLEIIWSKVKANVKRHLRVPDVAHPGVMEQRLVYLENAIDHAKATIVGGDCARAAQHSTVHHPTALAMGDMEVGK